VQVLQFKEMTEAGFVAAGAANRQGFLPALRLLDFGRTRKRLAGLAKARHQFGQSLVDEYRQRHPRTAEEETAPPRTVIGDLLREQERSPESHDDVVIRTVCLVSQSAQSTCGTFFCLLFDGQLVARDTLNTPTRLDGRVSRVPLVANRT
jgi:hypothetical protein